MTQSQLEILRASANVAGAILLFLQFLALVAVAVVLYMLWRGLRAARARLASAMPQVLAHVQHVQSTTTATADAIVAPQVRLLSAWAGVKAGARALLRRDGGTAAEEGGGSSHARPSLRYDGADPVPNGRNSDI
jgi:hypothetical protein